MKSALLFTWLLLAATALAEDAYAVVKKADKFYDAAIGFAGTKPEVVTAFQTLLQQQNADAAFKSLLQEATLPGQLYALCGLWFTDQAAFKQQIARYSRVKGKVPTMMGCIVSEDPVAELVKSAHPGTVRLRGPEDSLKAWWQRHPDADTRYDIAGGAWPSNFKDAR